MIRLINELYVRFLFHAITSPRGTLLESEKIKTCIMYMYNLCKEVYQERRVSTMKCISLQVTNKWLNNILKKVIQIINTVVYLQMQSKRKLLSLRYPIHCYDSFFTKLYIYIIFV